MKRFVLLLTLASALAACTGGIQTAYDPQVQCPSDTNKQMSHAEWEACYGHQDHDAASGK
jgi:hypothetical protein